MRSAGRYIASFMVALLFAIPSAEASRSCYNQQEYEAEQAIRIHSELMVIGLTCQRMPGNTGIYGKYRKFTLKHESLLAAYENRLLAFYRRQGKPPSKSLHHLRTSLANEISQRAIRMSTVRFCKNYSSRIDKALQMDQETVRLWARKSWPNQSTTEPLCDTL